MIEGLINEGFVYFDSERQIIVLSAQYYSCMFSLLGGGGYLKETQYFAFNIMPMESDAKFWAGSFWITMNPRHYPYKTAQFLAGEPVSSFKLIG